MKKVKNLDSELNKIDKIVVKNFKENLSKINALVNFYFKNDEKLKNMVFGRAKNYYSNNYISFKGLVSPVEAQNMSIEKTTHRILEEANIYYRNKK